MPKLASVLEKVPPGTQVHLHLEHLFYIDHSCLDLFSTWEAQQQQTGSALVVEWHRLVERYHNTVVS